MIHFNNSSNHDVVHVVSSAAKAIIDDTNDSSYSETDDETVSSFERSRDSNNIVEEEEEEEDNVIHDRTKDEVIDSLTSLHIEHTPNNLLAPDHQFGLLDSIDDNKWSVVDIILWDVGEDNDVRSVDSDSRYNIMDDGSSVDGSLISSSDESVVLVAEDLYGKWQEVFYETPLRIILRSLCWQEVNLWEEERTDDATSNNNSSSSVQNSDNDKKGTCTERDYIGIWIEIDMTSEH